ncbi:MAG: arsenical pump-driving ATPase [Deltaproteobacteria bacterium]|nr:arsenical pump-driving ATPase [Deltaproteobacteria bacterium]
MNLLENATHNLFFTGKGGVGKTTIASAAAIAFADMDRRVLLVSTDPASNLQEVLGTPVSSQARQVSAVAGLFVVNVDPEAAARAYRERVVGPYRGVLPEEAVAQMEEQLSGACTVEVAAFDEFARLLGDPQASNGFEHVVFDTAPTGHTLRLLELPAAWSDFLQNNQSGTSCLGPLSALQAQRKLYALTRKALTDHEKTTLVIVSRPEPSALAEAARTASELKALKILNQQLIINGVFTARDESDATAAALAERGRDSLEAMPASLSALPRSDIPLRPFNMIGISALRNVFEKEIELSGIASVPADQDEKGKTTAALTALLPDLNAAGRGVIMTMGKGGVGKTTLAATLAVRLASEGHSVHLTTTDPAAHVARAIGKPIRGLRVSCIDPQVETQAYAQKVMETAGRDLDEQGRAMLAEDLRSPCTEEIAVFRAFAQVVSEGAEGFVVIDTAPTGHTLLLLDTTAAYHRQLSRSMSDIPDSVRKLLPRLRDPEFTKILVVTLPEATPVHEAAALEKDLHRAGIEPFAWVINQSLTSVPVSDPVLVGRQAQESRYIDEVCQIAGRVFLVPWMAAPLEAAKL